MEAVQWTGKLLKAAEDLWFYNPTSSNKHLFTSLNQTALKKADVTIARFMSFKQWDLLHVQCNFYLQKHTKYKWTKYKKRNLSKLILAIFMCTSIQIYSHSTKDLNFTATLLKWTKYEYKSTKITVDDFFKKN